MHAKSCKILFADGATYVGEIQNDMLHGKGKLTSELGDEIYDGDWFEDKRHGFATFKYEGGKYTGMYSTRIHE